MKCIGGVICIPRTGSEGFEKCSKRIIGIIRKKSQSQLCFTSHESGGTWQELCKGVTLGRPWLLPGATGLRMGLDAAGCPPGQGAGHQGGRWFRGKATSGAVISFGGFNCVRARSRSFAPGKNICTLSPVGCRDKRGRGLGQCTGAAWALSFLPSCSWILHTFYSKLIFWDKEKTLP